MNPAAIKLLSCTKLILDKAIQIAAYWEGKGIWRPIRQNYTKI